MFSFTNTRRVNTSSHTEVKPGEIPNYKGVNSPDLLEQQINVRHLLKEVEYSHFCEKFEVAKEKLKSSRKKSLFIPSPVHTDKMPVKILRRKAVMRPLKVPASNSRLLLPKALFGAGVVYATFKLGIWGSAQQTNEMMTAMKTSATTNLKKISPVLNEQYNIAICYVKEGIETLPNKINNVKLKCSALVESVLKKFDK